MNVSRRTDYAIRLLLALAQDPDKVLPVSEIAELQSVPFAFARSIQRDLVKSGLVKTVRGVSGGMRLARDPKDITLFEIVDAIQGPVACSTCSADPEWCARMPGCKVHPVWVETNELIRLHLENKTLAELL